ncbi:MAG: GNAT family N-acetyltransferase [Candidatus Ventricola sp.]
MEILRQTGDARDLPLLEADDCTFSLLHKLLAQPCEKIVTDHARLILCHSEAPYPVWVWLPQDADEAELARAYQLMRGEFPGCTYHVGRALGAYAQAQGMGVSMRLLAYECDALAPQPRRADGRFGAARPEDAPLAAAWISRFQAECGIGQMDEAACLRQAEQLIGIKRLFLWRDAQGRPRAMCGVRQDGRQAALTHVFTEPGSRRRGYAQGLVWGVTQALLAQHMRAMLYADADYAASNACYRGVGYACRGEIWTLGD